MRFTALFFAAALSSCATTAKVVTYTDPIPSTEQAWVIRESCIGYGRGLVHFAGVDGVQFKRFQYHDLKLSPGRHVVTVQFLAPGSSWNVSGEGMAEIPYEFAKGPHIVRYLRTGPDTYKTWIEPIDLTNVDLSKPICMHPPFEDQRYWQ